MLWQIPNPQYVLLQLCAAGDDNFVGDIFSSTNVGVLMELYKINQGGGLCQRRNYYC